MVNMGRLLFGQNKGLPVNKLKSFLQSTLADLKFMFLKSNPLQVVKIPAEIPNNVDHRLLQRIAIRRGFLPKENNMKGLYGRKNEGFTK